MDLFNFPITFSYHPITSIPTMVKSKREDKIFPGNARPGQHKVGKTNSKNN